MGLKLRRDTAANWTSNDPTLESAELGVETDTGKVKIGDGSTAWTSLDYWAPGGTVDWGQLGGTLSDQTDLQDALDDKAATASPTFSGTVTIGSLAGLLKATSGAVSAATSGTDYAPATSGSAILKGNGSGGFTPATSGTDYAPPTSTSGLLKGNGSGGFTGAISKTDYAPATSGTSILKGSLGGFASAVSGTDYAPATSGTSLLKGNGSGGFSSAGASAIACGSGSGTTDGSGNLTITHTLGVTPTFFAVVFTGLVGGKTATFIPSGTISSSSVAGTVNQGNGASLNSASVAFMWLAVA